MPQKTYQNFRYPGTKPFRIEESSIFFGRDKDIEQLYKLVELEELVVLFSKSGLGKSSLLNAGLVPLVNKKEVFTPIYIRFGAYQDGSSATPVSISLESINSKDQEISWLDDLCDKKESLWYLLKRQQIANKDSKGFLLIFDQFEELFSYPEEHVTAFKKLVSEVLYEQIPQPVRFKLKQTLKNNPDSLSPEALELLHTPFKKRLLTAIRSDRMSELNQLTDYIPSILKNCYELLPLSRNEATLAIQKPARMINAHFSSDPFLYSKTAMDKILGFLTQNDTQPIESFQLQILCNNIEQKVMKAKLTEVKPEDIGDVKKIYENYYEDQISQLEGEDLRQACKAMLEEEFIFESEKRRLSLSRGQVREILKKHLNRELDDEDVEEILDQLIGTRLVRREQNAQTKGDFLYEISHDTLVEPLLRAKAKRVRDDEIKRQKEEREAEKQKIQRAQRRARRSMWVAIGIGTVIAVASLLSLVFFMKANSFADLTRKAEDEARMAQMFREQAEQTAKDAQMARDSTTEETKRLKRTLELFETLGVLEAGSYSDSISTAQLLTNLENKVEEQTIEKSAYNKKLNELIDQLYLTGSRNGAKRDEARKQLIREYSNDTEMIVQLLNHAMENIDEAHQPSLWQSIYIIENISQQSIVGCWEHIDKFIKAGEEKNYWGSASKKGIREIERKYKSGGADRVE